MIRMPLWRIEQAVGNRIANDLLFDTVPPEWSAEDVGEIAEAIKSYAK